MPSVGQLVGATAAVAALVAAAFASPRRPRPPQRALPVNPWVAGIVVPTVFTIPTVVGVILDLVDLRTGLWQHAESSCAGPAVRDGPDTPPRHRQRRPPRNVITAFTAEPIGDVRSAAKYGHDIIGLLAVLILLTIAALRSSIATASQ